MATLFSSTTQPRHWYPRANPAVQPSPWWYFGRAIYVSRRDYGRIFLAFVSLGVPLAALSLFLKRPEPLYGTVILAWLGLALLVYSLFGLYRMYGHPARQYFQHLLGLANVDPAQPLIVADLHIGTYRHTYLLANLLPQATLHSIDCWNVAGPPPEAAVQDVRELEPSPEPTPRLHPARAHNFTLPLPRASCDLAVLGFGTHEIPKHTALDKLFSEAQRILKPGGRLLLFEHGRDVHNFLIFGPVIEHVTSRAEWHKLIQAYFADVRYARASHAVDLFTGTRHA